MGFAAESLQLSQSDFTQSLSLEVCSGAVTVSALFNQGGDRNGGRRGIVGAEHGYVWRLRESNRGRQHQVCHL